MNMRKVALFFFILSLSMFFMLGSVSFAASDTMDVNITIGSFSEITVIPAILNWTGVSLGTAAGNKSVTIENTGSVNVTQLYVYGDALTDEVVRPYGTAGAGNYSAASVITINNQTGLRYYYVGRIEWNWTELLQNLVTTHLTSPVAWGFFKNTSNDYVWAVGNGTGGLCNQTDAQFAIEDDVDTGIASTRTPDDDSIGTPDFADANFSYFSIDRASSVLDGYCVAVNATCERIYVYKFDKRTGFTQCNNAGYLTENQVTPGSKFQIEANAFIPRGLPTGELNRATLTFVAT